jgi:hypothetical protein
LTVPPAPKSRSARCVHYKQPKLPIEHVAVKDGVERHAGFEVVTIRSHSTDLKRQGITGKPVVADMTEVMRRRRPVRYVQAA